MNFTCKKGQSIKFISPVQSVFDNSTIITVNDIGKVLATNDDNNPILIQVDTCVIALYYNDRIKSSLEAIYFVYDYDNTSQEFKYEFWDALQHYAGRCLYENNVSGVQNLSELAQELEDNLPSLDLGNLNLSSSTTMEMKENIRLAIWDSLQTMFLGMRLTDSEHIKNNDGREECFRCGRKTVKVAGFRKFYNICPECML